ncbi:MAG: FG-GAP-like repeat-containing protein, partial [bacterium]
MARHQALFCAVFTAATFLATGVQAAPEIAVSGNGQDIADGDATPSLADHTDFGKIDVTGGSLIRTYTITNSGSDNLTVGSVTMGGTHAADFTVTVQPFSPVAAGGSTTFQVQFDPSAPGTRSASVSFSNNDSDENPFDFSIQGDGYALSTNRGPVAGGNVLVVTNGALGNGTDITGVTICGAAATITGQGVNWVQVTVGAGTIGIGNIAITSTSLGVTTLQNAYTYFWHEIVTFTRIFEATVDGRRSTGIYAGGMGSDRPAVGDLDADGDTDIVIGGEDGTLSCFPNIGTRNNMYLAEPILTYAAIDVGNNAAPAFADIDGDGDLDLFNGSFWGWISFIENTGNTAVAQWGAVNTNYMGVSVGSQTCPALVDIDGDGDLDFFSGRWDGFFTFWKNTGTATAPQWDPPNNTYSNMNVGWCSAPAFADIDADGDFDLFSGEWGGQIKFCKNTGTVTSAKWAPATNYFGMTVGDDSAPALFDIDGDGDFDLLAGSYSGDIFFYENIGDRTNAIWKSWSNTITFLSFGYQSSPAVGDIDGDGDKDLYVMAASGFVRRLLINVGVPTHAQWDTGFTNNFPMGGETHEFIDIDADGDLDLFYGTSLGTVAFYQNIGTPTSPAWAARVDNFAGVTLGYGNAPAATFGDIDGDQDYDLFVGHKDGTILFFQNTGTPASPSWAAPVNNVANVDVGTCCMPAFGDVDQDGDLDLIMGNEIGRIWMCENTGTASVAQWAEAATNLFGVQVGRYATPELADMDGDGDPDMLLGEENGGLLYYRNESPKLRVNPPVLTIAAGSSRQFLTQGATGVVSWSFITNRSGGGLVVTNGLYTAGTNAPVLDVVEGRESGGLYGRVHINVIRPEDAAAIGKAIIIAGGKALDDPVWQATDGLADRAYLTVLHRGFAKTNVQYLSFGPAQDVDGDGMTDDVDGDTGIGNVTAAFTSFAQNADKLFVYLVDHGSDSAGQGYMRLNAGENLSAAQVDGWLDALQTANPNLQVTLVLDFCYAGSFLDEVALTNSTRRAVMAATTADQLTYFIAGGLVSFSDALFSSLQAGFDFKNAFETARGAMSSYQLAQMDDNGDGIYQGGIDGVASESNKLGASFIAGLDIPQIGDISPNQMITTGTTVTLWAKGVSSVYPIERTWCLIVPPSHNPNTNAGIPVLNIPELDLLYNTTLNRYETTFDGFT